ncbi:MAG TPA: GNAT family N-acetyltransferase [Gammaproteobacteria bacterium]
MPNDLIRRGAIVIRQAVIDDASVLAAAEIETARRPGLLVSRPEELKAEAFAAKIDQLATSGGYLVAERDGRPVGHGLLEPAPLVARSHAFQLTIVVHPGHTGQGIGKRLMQALLDWAEHEERVDKVELRVRSSNQVAIGLYRRFGFLEEGRFRAQLRLPDGTLFDDIAMAWFPRRLRAVPVMLEGEHVRLEPLSFDHLDGLCAVGLDESLWQWVPTPVRNRAEMREYLESALADQGRGVSLPFATVHKASGQVIGSTRFANMDLRDRRVEIGWTWIARPWQRTVINTEAKFLMLRHAFETLNCVRVELKTDVLNEPSRRAILRLGAKEEGIWRKHRYMWTGRFRDTVYYSILDSEWPSVKAGLQAKLTS